MPLEVRCPKLSNVDEPIEDRWCKLSNVEKPVEDCAAEEDAIDGEGGEAAGADPVHEPGYAAVGDDEGNDEADGENDPAVRIDLADANWIFDAFGTQGFQQVITCGRDHRWDRKKKGKFES